MVGNLTDHTFSPDKPWLWDVIYLDRIQPQREGLLFFSYSLPGKVHHLIVPKPQHSPFPMGVTKAMSPTAINNAGC